VCSSHSADGVSPIGARGDSEVASTELTNIPPARVVRLTWVEVEGSDGEHRAYAGRAALPAGRIERRRNPPFGTSWAAFLGDREVGSSHHPVHARRLVEQALRAAERRPARPGPLDRRCPRARGASAGTSWCQNSRVGGRLGAWAPFNAGACWSGDAPFPG
jgi:hypothetical protein